MPASNRASRRLRVSQALALTASLAVPCAPAQQPGIASDPLARDFQNPPAAARPRVWWHWMNGNITAAGIDQDLDWMHRVGIAGFQNFDAALNTPKVVDQRLIYMQPGWQEAFRHAVSKGDSLGFEMAIAGSPGWSETGGPWVRPEQAMKKLTWSATTISAGQPFRGTLSPPPRQTGPFGDLAQQDLMGAMGGSDAPPPVADFGADIAVIAFREPAAAPLPTPRVTTSAGSEVDSSHLATGDLNQSIDFPASKPGNLSWLQYEFPELVAIQSVTFAEGPPRNPLAIFASETNDGPMLQSSSDGQHFTDVVRIPTAGAVQHTLTFAPVAARFFRIAYTEKAPPPNMLGDIDMSDFGGAAPSGPPTHHVAEFALYAIPRINRFEEKAAFAAQPNLYPFATVEVPTGTAIASSDVLDLTSKLHSDGTLDWTPPPGAAWTILRLGYSLTGITNHPAPPEATGPEVDKLNKTDVTAYFNHYLDNYQQATGGNMGTAGHGKGLRYVITDSWEAGTQNWTPTMLADFQRLRGYDPRPWLPTLTGRIVGSAADSDRFLWDYRRTIEELLAENHYGTLNSILHQRGMGQYGESHEAGRATIGDGMEMKRYDDVPMSAMWTQRPGVNADMPGYNADVRESASVAHIYGRPFVAAESMTASAAPWGWSPATLKPTADKELAMGLNRFVIHSSVHQPLTGPGGADAGSPAPGLTLGPFGQWFNRNENWAEQATPWISYLARCSFLLQQGRFVADVAYFYGEDSNITAIFADHNPPVPEGHNFDYINADILEHILRADHGDLVTPSGMRYRVLVLDPFARHMSLPVLRRIHELVRSGVTVIGPMPIDDPSLADARAHADFTRLVAELWPSAAGPAHTLGKGRVLPADGTGPSLEAALQSLNLQPDTTYTRTSPDSRLLFVHRTLPEADLYFVDNRSATSVTTETSFRVAGRAPELFHPDTGAVNPVAYTTASGRTSVPLTLEPWGTVFVVFRHPTHQTAHTEPRLSENNLTTVEGPWNVSFEERVKHEDGPHSLTMATLTSLSDSANPAIRYFCGHATYAQHLNAPAGWFKPGAPILLDLGDVANLAEVSLNGKPLGTLWKAPFRLDVTGSLHPGDNLLEVRVANLWVNRLIGDAQPNATTKFTFTVRNPYKANSPLVPAGLLGPVRIVREDAAP